MRLRLRLPEESGFGVIELLVAMMMLNIGILAILGAFNSGIWALRKASKASTASALADGQIELYRALKYNSIALDSGALHLRWAGLDSASEVRSGPAARRFVGPHHG